MSAPSIVPTLADLQSALDSAERDLVCADMIDDFRRREVDMAECRRRRDGLNAQIAWIEGSL
jgi:hypothetical protein